MPEGAQCRRVGDADDLGEGRRLRSFAKRPRTITPATYPPRMTEIGHHDDVYRSTPLEQKLAWFQNAPGLSAVEPAREFMTGAAALYTDSDSPCAPPCAISAPTGRAMRRPTPGPPSSAPPTGAMTRARATGSRARPSTATANPSSSCAATSTGTTLGRGGGTTRRARRRRLRPSTRCPSSATSLPTTTQRLRRTAPTTRPPSPRCAPTRSRPAPRSSRSRASSPRLPHRRRSPTPAPVRRGTSTTSPSRRWRLRARVTAARSGRALAAPRALPARRSRADRRAQARPRDPARRARHRAQACRPSARP